VKRQELGGNTELAIERVRGRCIRELVKGREGREERGLTCTTSGSAGVRREHSSDPQPKHFFFGPSSTTQSFPPRAQRLHGRTASRPEGKSVALTLRDTLGFLPEEPGLRPEGGGGVAGEGGASGEGAGTAPRSRGSIPSATSSAKGTTRVGDSNRTRA